MKNWRGTLSVDNSRICRGAQKPSGDWSMERSAKGKRSPVRAERREFPRRIGRFCELTTLTERVITSRILRRSGAPPSMS
jgi:hypothetical protein